jgi:hypothetical protein
MIAGCCIVQEDTTALNVAEMGQIPGYEQAADELTWQLVKVASAPVVITTTCYIQRLVSSGLCPAEAASNLHGRRAAESRSSLQTRRRDPR